MSCWHGWDLYIKCVSINFIASKFVAIFMFMKKKLHSLECVSPHKENVSPLFLFLNKCKLSYSIGYRYLTLKRSCPGLSMHKTCFWDTYRYLSCMGQVAHCVKQVSGGSNEHRAKNLRIYTSLELFVKSWHQTHVDLAKTWVRKLMHKVTQVLLMLKLPHSKSGVKLLNFGFLACPTGMDGPS